MLQEFLLTAMAFNRKQKTLYLSDPSEIPHKFTSKLLKLHRCFLLELSYRLHSPFTLSPFLAQQDLTRDHSSQMSNGQETEGNDKK
jgi:hypothetical protein